MDTFKSYLKHPGRWINALLGRPNPVDIPKEQIVGGPAPLVDPQNPRSEELPRELDPSQSGFVHDFQKAKDLVAKMSEKIEEAAKPVLEKGVEEGKAPVEASQTFVSEKKSSSPIHLKKILPALLFGLVIIVVVLGGLTFFRSMNKPETPQIVTLPTPTLAPIIETEPSQYAEDEEVLKLQEDISVLEKEITSTSLRESTLNPPILNFDVSF